jgi:hypothetical protein
LKFFKFIRYRLEERAFPEMMAVELNGALKDSTMNLTRHIIDAVDCFWAEDVQILGAWQDGPAAACVVYRRTIDPMMTLGCRLEFHPEAADGTIEGFARDVAVNLAEPILTLITRRRQDQYAFIGWPSPRTVPRQSRPSRSSECSPIGNASGMGSPNGRVPFTGNGVGAMLNPPRWLGLCSNRG